MDNTPPRVRTFTVPALRGLHLRPAAMLVKTACRYASRITISRHGKTVDAKHIMNVMLLEAVHGAEVTVRAEGPDASEAMAAITDLFVTAFGEFDHAGSCRGACEEHKHAL